MRFMAYCLKCRVKTGVKVPRGVFYPATSRYGVQGRCGECSGRVSVFVPYFRFQEVSNGD